MSAHSTSPVSVTTSFSDVYSALMSLSTADVLAVAGDNVAPSVVEAFPVEAPALPDDMSELTYDEASIEAGESLVSCSSGYQSVVFLATPPVRRRGVVEVIDLTLPLVTCELSPPKRRRVVEVIDLTED